MKRTLLAIVISTGMAGITGIACANGASQSLATVAVKDSTRRAIDCTPPSSSSDCAALHAKIRANFSPGEINMLFGAATSSLEYPTSYTRVEERYRVFLHDYEASNGVAVVVVGDPTKASKP